MEYNNIDNNTGYDLSVLYKALDLVKPGEFHISKPGSTVKLGNIAAFNLLPVVTCGGCACPGCYAIRTCLCHGYNIEKNDVLRAWAENTKTAIHDLPALRNFLIDYIYHYSAGINGSHFFRLHVSGDFFNGAYVRMWAEIASYFPMVKFLAFTKQYDIIRGVDFPKNFIIILSGGNKKFCAPIPADLAAKFPVTYCYDDKHGDVFPEISALIARGEIIPAGGVSPDAVPQNEFINCSGACDLCGACWFLPERKQNVAMKKH